MDPRIFPSGYFADPVIGDSNLSVYIGGLSLINKLGKNWHAQFLDHLDDHRLNIRLQMSENGGAFTQLFALSDAEPGEIGTISVKLDHQGNNRATYFSSAGDNRDYSNMANFTSDEMHGAGRPVNVNNTAGTALVKFELDGGKLYTARLADENGNGPDLYRFEKSGNVKRPLGHWVGFDNKCPVGSTLAIGIEGPRLNLKLDPIFNVGTRFRLMIDNMCTQPSCSGEVDFAYYYKTAHHGKSGIIDESPIELVQYRGGQSTLNFKVACNAALATANDT